MSMWGATALSPPREQLMCCGVLWCAVVCCVNCACVLVRLCASYASCASCACVRACVRASVRVNVMCVSEHVLVRVIACVLVCAAEVRASGRPVDGLLELHGHRWLGQNICHPIATAFPGAFTAFSVP